MFISTRRGGGKGSLLSVSMEPKTQCLDWQWRALETSIKTHMKVIQLLVCTLFYGFSIRSYNKNCFLSHTDIAIGAPYADDGAGKVYIYHGSAKGINSSPAQVGFVELCLRNFTRNCWS